MDGCSSGPDTPPGVDTSVAHIARIQNYLRGGTDNFPADREAARQSIAAYPGLAASIRSNQAFLGRAVRYLAGPAGVRQFLDIGTGCPPLAASTRSPARWHPAAGSCTSTTTI